MVAVKPPQGDMASAVVTLREGGGGFFKDPDAISPVTSVEMISKPVPSLRGHRSSGEGTGALCCDFR